MNVFELALHLRLCGVLLIALALFHAALPKRFGWREEMMAVSLLSRQIFYVHTFFIALTVGLMGVLSFFYADELLRPAPVTRTVLGGLAIFWACRLAFQFFVYDATLWRTKKFETRMHWLFSVLWIYLTLVFSAAWWHQFNSV
jgi:hypothetical protein